MTSSLAMTASMVLANIKSLTYRPLNPAKALIPPSVASSVFSQSCSKRLIYSPKTNNLLSSVSTMRFLAFIDTFLIGGKFPLLSLTNMGFDLTDLLVESKPL